jgi:gluconate 2-dehydrogenase gamma chain
MPPISRRDFVVIGAASAAQAAPAPEFVIFTASQADLVKLIAEQIIPADHDPGATDAGVVYYIDRQLAGPLSPLAQLYRDALAAFEPMREMAFAAQTEFLKSVEKKEKGDAAARLFSVMIDHAMQGFYGAPSHGGNRDEVSWKMLGIQHEMDGHH